MINILGNEETPKKCGQTDSIPNIISKDRKGLLESRLNVKSFKYILHIMKIFWFKIATKLSCQGATLKLQTDEIPSGS